jgi:hypothetical protein
MAATLATNGNSNAFRAILWAGLVAGILDITAAIVTTILRGGAPGRMLQGIASGVLGPSSFAGGKTTMVLGLLLHFVIAFGATIVYYFATRNFSLSLGQAVVSGFLFGIAVYFFMQQVVIPLSAITRRAPFTWSGLLIGVGVHMFCVGLPIALLVRRFSAQRA